MRQRRWLELLKDYDCTILYHSGRANIVADALSRMSNENLATLITKQPAILKDLHQMGMEIRIYEHKSYIAPLKIHSTLIEKIKSQQSQDPELLKKMKNINSEKFPRFKIHEGNHLWFDNRLCIPACSNLKKEILTEAHCSPFSVHPRSTKMYRDVREKFWWDGMKRDIAEYVEKCLTCQQVKAEHQKPRGTLQPLPIASGVDFPVSHPSQNCSRKSLLNHRVPQPYHRPKDLASNRYHF